MRKSTSYLLTMALCTLPEFSSAARRVPARGAVRELVHTTLFSAPVALVGQSGSTELAIVLPPPQAQRPPPRLVLHWAASAIVDAQLSTLSVELDDVPVSTIRLVQGGADVCKGHHRRKPRGDLQRKRPARELAAESNQCAGVQRLRAL